VKDIFLVMDPALLERIHQLYPDMQKEIGQEAVT